MAMSEIRRSLALALWWLCIKVMPSDDLEAVIRALRIGVTNGTR